MVMNSGEASVSVIDMTTRDLHVDESLGLNSAWYADVLMSLTEDRLD